MITEKLRLPKTNPKSGRVLKTTMTGKSTKLEELKQEKSVKALKHPLELEDPEMEDLETLLESCWKLAASLPGKDENSQSNIDIKDYNKVSTPKGLTLPTLIPKGTSYKGTLSSNNSKKLSSIDEGFPHSISPTLNGVHTAADNRVIDPIRTGNVSKVILGHDPGIQKTAHSKFSRTITRKAPSQTVSGERAWLDHVVDTTFKSKQGMGKDNRQEITPVKQVCAQSGSKEQVSTEDNSCNNSDEMNKEVSLDASTAASSDTGIVDCSASSEQNDTNTFAHHSGLYSETRCDGVLEDSLTTLSENERVSVDISGCKMSDRDYLYQNESGQSGHGSWWEDWQEGATEYLLSDTSFNEQNDKEEASKGQSASHKVVKARILDTEDLGSLFLPAYAARGAVDGV